MTREEFERLKEAEKAHLRKMKELRAQAHEADRARRLSGTLASMATGARDLLDENARLVGGLSESAALGEARYELAMEGREQGPGPSLEEAEEALRKERARRLVESMRAEAETPAPQQQPPAGQASAQQPAPPADAAALPEKTIGRMR